MSASKSSHSRIGSMRVVYLSRQFNRSGYSVLQSLLACAFCDVVGVVIPPLRPSQRYMSRLDSPATAWIEAANYRFACFRQGAKPLRFEGSLHRLATSSGVKVEVVPSLKDLAGLERLRLLKPDLLVLGGGWPELLPAQVFELAPLGAINTHPSLLPGYRGTDVHRWQTLGGEVKSGTTIHYIDGQFDTGDIIGQEAVTVDLTATPQELFQRTADVAGDLMLNVVERIAAAAPSRVAGLAQANACIESLPKWPVHDSDFLRIDPTLSATQVERHIRASTQESYAYDGAWFSVFGREYVIRRASLSNLTHDASPGTLVVLEGTALLVCSDGVVSIDRVQQRSAVPMTSRSRSGRWFARRCLGGLPAVPIDDL